MARTSVTVEAQPLTLAERCRQMYEDNAEAMLERQVVEALAGNTQAYKAIEAQYNPAVKHTMSTTNNFSFGPEEIKQALEATERNRIHNAQAIEAAASSNREEV